MKNIMKKLLLFVCLMTGSSNLFAMHRMLLKAKYDKANAAVTVPAKMPAPAKTALPMHDLRDTDGRRTPAIMNDRKTASSTRATIRTARHPHLDEFIAACESLQAGRMKDIFIKANFTTTDIDLASKATESPFPQLIHQLFYQANENLPNTEDVIKNAELSACMIHALDVAVHLGNNKVVERIIKNYAEDNKDLAIAIRRHFAQTALTGKADMVECILNSCTSSITQIIDDKLFLAVALRVNTKFKSSTNKGLQSVKEKLDLEADFRRELREAERAVNGLEIS